MGWCKIPCLRTLGCSIAWARVPRWCARRCTTSSTRAIATWPCARRALRRWCGRSTSIGPPCRGRCGISRRAFATKSPRPGGSASITRWGRRPSAQPIPTSMWRSSPSSTTSIGRSDWANCRCGSIPWAAPATGWPTLSDWPPGWANGLRSWTRPTGPTPSNIRCGCWTPSGSAPWPWPPMLP